MPLLKPKALLHASKMCLIAGVNVVYLGAGDQYSVFTSSVHQLFGVGTRN